MARVKRRGRRVGRRMRRALVISALLNIMLIATVFYGYHRAEFGKEGQTAPKERITIEHVAKVPLFVPPRPKKVAADSAPAPAPAPKHVAKTPPQAIVPKRVAVVVPPHRFVHVRPPVEKPVITKHATLPKVVASLSKPPPASATGPKKLSDEQIASIENNLGAAIAHDKERENPLNVQSASTGSGYAMKHYGMDVSDLSSGGLGHQGLCSPTKSWTDGGFDYYYVDCNVRASDGTFDVEDVPWPLRFPPNHDPFEGTAPRGPIPMPLPGWHLTPGQFVADGVRQYALAHGVNL